VVQDSVRQPPPGDVEQRSGAAEEGVDDRSDEQHHGTAELEEEDGEP